MQQHTNQNVLEDLSRLESILVNGYAEDSDDKAMLPKLCNKYPFQLVQLFDQHQLMYKPDTQALILISYKVASCILQQSLWTCSGLWCVRLAQKPNKRHLSRHNFF